MGQVNVDTEKVREVAQNLRKLKSEASKMGAKKSKPTPMNCKGLVAEELILVMDEIDTTWEKLYDLTDKTIEFLTKRAESIDTSDAQSAKAVE